MVYNFPWIMVLMFYQLSTEIFYQVFVILPLLFTTELHNQWPLIYISPTVHIGKPLVIIMGGHTHNSKM